MSDEEKKGGGFRAILGVLIAVVAVGSAGMRFARGDDATAAKKETARSVSSTSLPGGASGFVGGTTGTSDTPTRHGQERSLDEGTEGTLDDALPVVTEASFFGMIGFALGYFARKVLKLAAIFTGMIAFLLMGLQYFEIIQIDWNRAYELFNDVVLDIRSNESISDFIKHRLPGAGGLTAGYLVGFRKG